MGMRRVVGVSALGEPIHEHGVPIVAAAQAIARGHVEWTTSAQRYHIASIVEWVSIWAHHLQYARDNRALGLRERFAVGRSIESAEQVLLDLLRDSNLLPAVPSIPGQRIVDPETGRVWPIHDRWPKCRWNSDPVAKAAHNQRITDPKVLAQIEAVEPTPAICNCEWCFVAQEDFGGEAYAAWLRAHKDARETWPAAYWERLYPMLKHVKGAA